MYRISSRLGLVYDVVAGDGNCLGKVFGVFVVFKVGVVVVFNVTVGNKVVNVCAVSAALSICCVECASAEKKIPSLERNEARDTCSRLNVLKLWEETTIDLDRLGLKSVDADWSNKKQARASTARLQLSLLKVALLLGVHVNVDRTHAKEFELRRASDEGADVLIVATGFRADLYAKLRDTTVVRRYDSGSGESTTTDWSEGFQPMEAGRAPAAAIAVVCHFERNGKSAEAKAWARTFEPFDWTVQDARGADKSEAQLREMQQRYGMFCIAPKALAAEGIHLENIICYSNKGKEPFTAVPPSYYFIFHAQERHDHRVPRRGGHGQLEAHQAGRGHARRGRLARTSRVGQVARGGRRRLRRRPGRD